jgi:hypothetical protein
VLQEEQEQIHRLPGKPETLRATPQAIGGYINLELSEAVYRWPGRCVHV